MFIIVRESGDYFTYNTFKGAYDNIVDARKAARKIDGKVRIEERSN